MPYLAEDPCSLRNHQHLSSYTLSNILLLFASLLEDRLCNDLFYLVMMDFELELKSNCDKQNQKV